MNIFNLHSWIVIISYGDDAADSTRPHKINVCKMPAVSTILLQVLYILRFENV